MKKIILILALIFSCCLTAQTKIYEIQNKSKGVISELTPANLLLIKDDFANSATQAALDLKENSANKQNSLAVDGTGVKYPTVDATNAGLATKQNTLTNPITGTFVAGRVSYSSSNSTLTDSSKLLWDNTNSYFEVNGNAPRFTLKNNLNNFSTYFTNNADGTLFLKNHQDKTLAVFSNPVNSTEQPQMAIGKVSSIPVESQLYVYGGMNGANIDARGSNSADESNLDLENSDWLTNPKSIGLSTFGDNFNLGGDILGYERKKSSVLRFSNDKSFITSLAPIKLGINNLEIGNINSTGIEAISFTKSSAPATNILLAGGGDIAQNTAFNKNFGTTVGTVVEGGTLGTNAYTSTAYLPLTGGTINGDLTVTDGTLFASSKGANFRFKFDGTNDDGVILAASDGSLYFGNWSLSRALRLRTNGNAELTAGTMTALPAVLSTELVTKGQLDTANYLPLSGGTLTGTLTAASYTATSLPVFENNAAASSLAVGQFYRTSTGVLMVKF